MWMLKVTFIVIAMTSGGVQRQGQTVTYSTPNQAVCNMWRQVAISAANPGHFQTSVGACLQAAAKK